jgi:hypothetical protein
MRHRIPLIALLTLSVMVLALSARAQSADDKDYNIMAPEKGTAKKPVPAPVRKHPRGSSTLVVPTPLPPPLHYNPPPVQAVTPPSMPVPPSLYVPQTGMVVPNLPSAVGSSESSQDRAIRCSHQAGVYGPNMTGDRNTYVGGCINQ